MKLFKIRGGVHPKDNKSLSAECAIAPMPMPKLLRIPLQQHIGAPAEPVVKKGDKVKKGQVLAVGQGAISAPVHAPTSGQIMAIGRYTAPHASGLPTRTITLKPDGEDTWTDDLPAPLDPDTADAKAISARVSESGIVGMGGATFPSAVKLGLGGRYDLHTLVINGAECEPYLTCDDRLMRERTEGVIDGIAIMAKALGVKTTIVAIESNKPQAFAAMSLEAGKVKGIEVVKVPTQYPMGSEKHLVQTLTGKETPARALTADIGVVVHNGATAYAVHDAVRHGRPLISRVVTVSGAAIKTKANLDVLIGTPIQDIIDHCDGFAQEPTRLLTGGPMMGQPVSSTKAPIVKGTNGILGLNQQEAAPAVSHPCIRCASCVSACPCGLVPLEMAARIRKDELDKAVDIGLMDCVACGSCAFTCPAGIPLVQYFNYAKGKLTAQQRQKHKNEETKRLAAARNERMERLKREKKEAMARMKAAKAAKEKAAAEKAAAEGKPSEAAAEEKVG